jgi:hypothetical protein
MPNESTRRLRRLERKAARQDTPELAIVVCQPSETSEQAWARELAERPHIARAKHSMIINLNKYSGQSHDTQ